MKVLIIDDDTGSQLLLAELVKKQGCEPVIFPDAESFQQAHPLEQPTLLLLNRNLPGMDGLELCSTIRSEENGDRHYIILVSAREAPEDVLRALDSGASDYITKGMAPAEKRARVGVGLRTVTLERDQEELIHKLHELTRVDSFTGLLNHTAVLEELSMELNRSHREDTFTGVLMMDIDNFKAVNDTYGHIVGDQVILRFSRLLRQSSRPYDRIGRYGGDEFLMILPRTDVESSLSIAERIRLNAMTLNLDDLVVNLRITCSCGICTSDHKLKFASALVAAADNALYRAKESGRNRSFSCRH